MLTYNNAIQVFPAVVVAGMLGFDRREFFELEEGDRDVPVVSFRPGTPAAADAADGAPAP